MQNTDIGKLLKKRKRFLIMQLLSAQLNEKQYRTELNVELQKIEGKEEE